MTATPADRADPWRAPPARRWLAIAPDASLSSDLAPKLREPFVAAQAFMAAHGRLAVSVSRRSATDVDVWVESDPLRMVAAVALDDGGAVESVPLGVDHRVSLVGHAGAARMSVVVLDEFGNHLLELPSGRVAAAVSPPPQQPPRHGSSLVARWTTWAVPAAACAAAGVGFGLAARRANSELTAGIQLSDQHYYAESMDLRARRDRDALVANAMFVAAGGLAVVATIMYLRRARPEATVIAPTAGTGTAGVEVLGTW